LEQYNTNEKKWIVMPKMSVPQDSLSAVVFQDHIWTIGGSVDNYSTNTVKYFNLEQNRSLLFFT
jgi:hypothetical protein